MRLLTWFALAAVLGASVGWISGTASADEPLPTSFTSQVTPNAVDNAVRIGGTNLMQYPRIAIDRTPGSPRFGTVYVVGLVGWECASVVVVASIDGGQSFGAPRTADGCVLGRAADVIVAGNGTLFLAAPGPTIFRSSDGGATWQNLTTLGNATDQPSLDWDPVTDSVSVAWTDLRTTAAWEFHPGPVSFAASGDGGETWTAPRSILPAGVEGDGAQVAAHGDRIVVALLVPQSGGVRVAAVASGDGGATWGDPKFLSRADPCISWAAPSIAASGGGLFAASWYEDEEAHDSALYCTGDWGSRVRAFVSVSRDGGATFSAGILAGGPPGWFGASFGDAVAVDNLSHVYLTWHSIAPGWESAEVLVAVSDGDAAAFESSNFTIAMNVSGGNSTQQENLAAGPGGSVFLLWAAFSTWGAPEDGIFVRRVVGEVSVSMQLMPGVSEDVPITVELRGSETISRAWSGSGIVVHDVPPTAYDLNVTRGNDTVALGSIRIRAWAMHALVIQVGESTSLPVEIPWWAIVPPAVVLVGVAVYAYARRSSARRPR